MKRLASFIGLATATLLSACATEGGYTYTETYYSGGAYGGPYDNNAGYYDPYCERYDYYDPPWGYPSDYCRYDTWNDPIYYGGSWYSGPIYHRNYEGFDWFWLNG
ncbi:MAG: hypothetical protein RJB62_717, partial [Pseudomonadota bacterium]